MIRSRGLIKPYSAQLSSFDLVIRFFVIRLNSTSNVFTVLPSIVTVKLGEVDVDEDLEQLNKS